MSVLAADGLPWLSRLADAGRAIGIDIGAYRLSLYGFVSAILVGILLYFTVRLTLKAVKWLLRRNAALDDTQRLLTEKLTGVLLFGVAALAGIDLLGIDLTTLAVFSGTLGLALGFGLQKTVGNLIAGIILLMDRSIKPGDVIVVGDGSSMTASGGTSQTTNVGRVGKIGVRAVTVVTRDGKKHLIPNELLMTQPVENWSYSSPEVRVRMRVPVGYDSDIRLAQRLMIEAAKANPRVLTTPEPMVWITGFGERAVEHELRVWIADPESGLGNVQGEVFLAIWDAFRANGVTLPYPQLDVRMRETGEPTPGQ
jgi:small-conductance mechanosensitive channel